MTTDKNGETKLYYDDFRERLLNEYGSNFVSVESEKKGRYFISNGNWMNDYIDQLENFYLDSYVDQLPPEKFLYYYYDLDEEFVDVFTVLILNIHETDLDDNDLKTIANIYKWVNAAGSDPDLYVVNPKKKIELANEILGDMSFVANKIDRSGKLETSIEYPRLDSIRFE